MDPAYVIAGIFVMTACLVIQFTWALTATFHAKAENRNYLRARDDANKYLERATEWKDRALDAEAKLKAREDDVEKLSEQIQVLKNQNRDLQQTIDRIKDTLQFI